MTLCCQVMFLPRARRIFVHPFQNAGDASHRGIPHFASGMREKNPGKSKVDLIVSEVNSITPQLLSLYIISPSFHSWHKCTERPPEARRHQISVRKLNGFQQHSFAVMSGVDSFVWRSASPRSARRGGSWGVRARSGTNAMHAGRASL